MSTKITPQLRFPEFTDEWQVKKLGESLESISSGKSNTTSNGTKYPIYGSTGEIGKSATCDYSGDKLLIARVGANAGSMYRVSGSYKVSDNTLIVNLKDDVDTSFVQYSLINFNINRLVFGSGQPLVTGGMLKNTKLAFPSKPEQEKIADFLTAVDERIAVGEKRLELLETYKRGVMQKIFSQQVRFKDENGNSYPDWEEKKLGEIGKVITGKTPSTSEKSHWLGKVKFVTPTDMDGKKHQETSSRSVSYTGSLLLPEKSIMYTCIASIGKMSMSVGETITNQQINSFIPSKEICNDFAYYNLLWLTPRIVATQSNNTLPIINKSEFSKFKLLVPAKEEQQKIADFLTTLDARITAEKSKLTAARQFKKALLQRMFV